MEASRRTVETTQMFSIFASFGSINSTISPPGCISHASVPPEVGELRKLPADLVRISVGIEGTGDLSADLDRLWTPPSFLRNRLSKKMRRRWCNRPISSESSKYLFPEVYHIVRYLLGAF
jgi:hypothetical protein